MNFLSRLRRFYLAAHAPEAWGHFQPAGVPPHPEKSARLQQLEKEVKSAMESDYRAALLKHGPKALFEPEASRIVRDEQSLFNLVVTKEMREELEQLAAQHNARHAEWRKTFEGAVLQQWPWFYADLVLAGEKGGEG